MRTIFFEILYKLDRKHAIIHKQKKWWTDYGIQE